MIEKGIYSDLARANADAVRGMQPKVTVWNTDSNAGASADGSMAVIRNMYQMSTINEQMGIMLPEWPFSKMSGNLSDKEKGVNEVSPG